VNGDTLVHDVPADVLEFLEGVGLVDLKGEVPTAPGIALEAHVGHRVLPKRFSIPAGGAFLNGRKR
jgi:hypothetical protein